ncbi:hypothetical protein BDZ45DRAFT_749143 [Acephala macrosclerotiorum]|nr:hypothetical protein BDZ45DRAFT_749143 [Acephala macrosclerotiorum]
MNSTAPTPPPIPTKPANVIKAPRFSFRSTQSFMTVYIGNGSGAVESFTVLKSFICHHSPFFKAAFNGPYLEGQSQSITLEDLDANVFALFVEWLYTQNVPAEHNTGEKVTMLQYAKLWVLAKRFVIPTLQNIVMKTRLYTYPRGWARLIDIKDLSKTVTMAAFTKYVYENASKDSSLRHYIMLVGLLACRELQADRLDGWKKDWVAFLDAAFVPEAASDFLKITFTASFDMYKDSLRLIRANCGNILVPEDETKTTT